MRATTEKINPRLAEKYLELNTVNRPIRQSHVEFLSKEISGGRWKMNGASIVFNGGTLVDGQHRLWAIIEAKTPIDTIVVRGAEDDSFPTIDTGKCRTGGDVLHIAGEKNPSVLSSAARLCIGYLKKNFFARGRISNTIVVDFVRDNPGLADSVEYVLKTKSPQFVSRGIGACLHYLMSKRDARLADTLFRGIGVGFSVADGGTFGSLREKLIACAVSNAKLSKAKTHPRVVGAYVVKAWNAKRMSRRLNVFRFIDGEDFPRIK